MVPSVRKADAPLQACVTLVSLELRPRTGRASGSPGLLHLVPAPAALCPHKSLALSQPQGLHAPHPVTPADPLCLRKPP